MSALELWGGIECTVARVGDTWRNQVAELGLTLDEAQLQALRSLGIQRLRFPVLWETVMPAAADRCDWRWHDERLATLQRLGIAPIAGLVHHGSGPRWTHLLDPQFPPQLAAYAARVARRYPWIDAYTPINEPLTTARFSALYGHWYPHHRDPRSFLRALVNQCWATVLAMNEIRRVNPAARLVCTEDLGKVYAPTQLGYQADHENERRWLGFDLLCGRVTTQHALYRYLIDHGIGADELTKFADADGMPDIVGINHYVTSDRWLEPALQHCPPESHGGNGKALYADIEAVRVAGCAHHDLGLAARLREVWQRYRLPMAVTEVHLGCSREEQVRWLHEAWQTAGALRDEGIDLRAITAWSLFGAVDWNSLLTERRGHYESGAFDLRRSTTRPTLVGKAIGELATRARFDHPVLANPGWWRRPERLNVGPVRTPAPTRSLRAPRPLLITGATGTLGRALSRLCTQRGLAHRLLTRAQMDIADEVSVSRALAEHQAWAVVNAAGYVRVADADREADQRADCFRENAQGAATLASACASRGIALATFSSDLVFDGSLGRPYVESDPTSPSGAYGHSKNEAERRVLEALPEALVVRTSAFFGPWDRYNFVHQLACVLQSGERFSADADSEVSPTYVPDLVHGVLDLLLDGEQGVWHLTNQGSMTWYELACAAAAALHLPVERVDRQPARVRSSTALASERGFLLPPLEDALARYARAREVEG